MFGVIIVVIYLRSAHFSLTPSLGFCLLCGILFLRAVLWTFISPASKSCDKCGKLENPTRPRIPRDSFQNATPHRPWVWVCSWHLPFSLCVWSFNYGLWLIDNWAARVWPQTKPKSKPETGSEADDSLCPGFNRAQPEEARINYL